MDENPTEAPHGAATPYPPPTLIVRRSRAAWARYAVLLITIALVLGTCTATRLMKSDKTASTDAGAKPTGSSDVVPIVSARAVAPADGPVAGPVRTAGSPQVQATAQVQAQPAPADLRKANRFYYVNRLGDGPAAIYSGANGRWDYAFACSAPGHTIEFIAVGTGDPGGFQGQRLAVGANKLDLDATYAKDGGGTISADLPVKSPFLGALKDGAPLDVKLVASHGATLQINADVVRLIGECRGR